MFESGLLRDKVPIDSLTYSKGKSGMHLKTVYQWNPRKHSIQRIHLGHLTLQLLAENLKKEFRLRDSWCYQSGNHELENFKPAEPQSFIEIIKP